ncbi:MAG: ABC transporter permease [Candidatus Omnitrophica bacterium]|nr:ABC transporter permease [Candidatus Omnitrophota bacterium]
MRYELFLALRYLGGLKRSQPFVSVIAAISVCGVAVGVAALLVVLGVMTGFDADLQSKILGSNPHLVVEAESGVEASESFLRRIEQVPGVAGAAPFAQTQVILKFDKASLGAILRGVDPAREGRVTGLSERLIEGSWPPAPGELVVGSQLASRLRLHPDDEVLVWGGDSPKPRAMKIRAVMSTGMYDYDLHLALAPLATVQELIGLPGKASGIGIRLKEAMKAPEVKRELLAALGFPYWVVTWMDLNQSLFAALKLEKVTMFVILTLIVLVACFNIVATLLMVVVGKTKEVGILKAVGATNGSIGLIFTWAGLLIGLAGTALGTAGGMALCGLLAKYQFIQLPPEIYYLDRLPVQLTIPDTLRVTGSALGLAWISCLYPAWVAARLDPAAALRYE